MHCIRLPYFVPLFVLMYFPFLMNLCFIFSQPFSYIVEIPLPSNCPTNKWVGTQPWDVQPILKDPQMPFTIDQTKKVYVKLTAICHLVWLFATNIFHQPFLIGVKELNHCFSLFICCVVVEFEYHSFCHECKKKHIWE